MRGGVIFEAALALPVFILFILGTIELGIGIRSYLSATRALNIAAHKISAVSAVDDWRRSRALVDEDVCMEIAGDTFVDELKRAGGSLEAATTQLNQGAGLGFSLAGFPFQFTGGYPGPRAYELRAKYTYSCLLCGVIGQDITFRMSSISILESTRGCEPVGRPGNQVAGYFATLAPGSRVRSVPKSKVK